MATLAMHRGATVCWGQTHTHKNTVNFLDVRSIVRSLVYFVVNFHLLFIVVTFSFSFIFSHSISPPSIYVLFFEDLVI